MHGIDFALIEGDDEALAGVGDVIQLDVHREKYVRLMERELFTLGRDG
jgi:hypothetical protein